MDNDSRATEKQEAYLNKLLASKCSKEEIIKHLEALKQGSYSFNDMSHLIEEFNVRKGVPFREYEENKRTIAKFHDPEALEESDKEKMDHYVDFLIEAFKMKIKQYRHNKHESYLVVISYTIREKMEEYPDLLAKAEIEIGKENMNMIMKLSESANGIGNEQ